MWLTLWRPCEAAEAQGAEFDLDAALWRPADGARRCFRWPNADNHGADDPYETCKQ